MAEGRDSVGSDYADHADPVVCSEHILKCKYFCKAHMLELCPTCRRMGHKICETVVDIGQAAEEIFSDYHGDKIIESVKELRERFESCKNTAESLRDKLPGKRQNAIDSVKQTRKFIDDYLDDLEAGSLSQIDQTFEKETETLNEKIDVCKASAASLAAILSSYEKAMSVGMKQEQFIEINRATKQTKQYCNMLLDIYREMTDINVMFETNDKISDLKDILRSLGTVSVRSSLDPYNSIGSAAIYTGEIMLKKVSDVDKVGARKTHDKGSSDLMPYITAFDVLPDGRRLALDQDNRKLQLYDKHGIFLAECSLPVDGKAVFSCVLIGKNKAMVSTASSNVLFVDISNQLTAKETSFTHNIGAMTNYGEDIVAVSFSHCGIIIAVVDKDLNIKRQIIEDDRTIFKAPGFLAVNTEESIVFVLDVLRGCYGITMDGNVLFNYQHPHAIKYWGLVISGDGLFIGVHYADCLKVVKLSFGGDRQANIDFGESHPLKVVENELVLYTRSDDKPSAQLRFYSLLK